MSNHNNLDHNNIEINSSHNNGTIEMNNMLPELPPMGNMDDERPSVNDIRGEHAYHGENQVK